MGKFEFTPADGRMTHTDGARTVWASDAVPVSLLPPAHTITLNGKTIAFPDFVKNNILVFGLWTTPTSGSSGMSFATILPNEYGPTKSGVYLLAQEVVGSVPAGTNYLDISATLNWTTQPDKIMLQSVARGVPLGQQTYLVGGCAILEHTYAFRRIIKFVLVGTNVILQRFQSVTPRAIAHNPATLKTGAQTWTGGPYGPWGDKWTHGGSAQGHVAFELNRRLGGNINKARGGPNAPSTSDISDFSSLWTGDFEIRPGVIQA